MQSSSWYILPYLCSGRFQFSMDPVVCNSASPVASKEDKCIDIIEECYLYKPTNGPTRCRSDDIPSQLDLIFLQINWKWYQMCSAWHHWVGATSKCWSSTSTAMPTILATEVTMKMPGKSCRRSLSQPRVVCSRCVILLKIELMVYAIITYLLSILKEESGSQTIPMTKRCWIWLERRPSVIGSGWLDSMVLKGGVPANHIIRRETGW